MGSNFHYSNLENKVDIRRSVLSGYKEEEKLVKILEY